MDKGTPSLQAVHLIAMRKQDLKLITIIDIIRTHKLIEQG
jgi:hypothetical protein